MRAGRLRHRLTLQSKSISRDAYGGAIESWITEDTVWGAIEPLSGRELFLQEQIQAEVKVRIVMRYHSSIDTTWRIKNDGLFYDIVDVINENTIDRTLTLMCRQGVSEDSGSDVTPSYLLLESGDYFLLETGDKLILDGF